MVACQAFYLPFWDNIHFETVVRTPLRSFTALLKDINLVVLLSHQQLDCFTIQPPSACRSDSVRFYLVRPSEFYLLDDLLMGDERRAAPTD